MAKIHFTKLGKKAGTVAGRSKSIPKKRVRTAEGDLKTLRTLDTGSKTFGSDLTYTFTRNVEKARRENKRVVGASDFVPSK